MRKLLVGPHEPESEHGSAVVRAHRLARGDGVGDDAQLLFGDAERRQRVAAALRMDDDPLETAECTPPESGLRGRPPGQQVVGGEDERRPVAKQPRVHLREREPLNVDEIGRGRCKARKAERMLQHFQRQSQPGAAEEPRGKRVEELTAPVAVRLGHGAEAEARGHEGDVGAGADECLRERVVVRRREGGGIGDDDAHGFVG